MPSGVEVSPIVRLSWREFSSLLQGDVTSAPQHISFFFFTYIYLSYPPSNPVIASLFQITLLIFSSFLSHTMLFKDHAWGQLLLRPCYSNNWVKFRSVVRRKWPTQSDKFDIVGNNKMNRLK